MTAYVMSVAKFERFFRVAGDVDVAKEDLKRYSDFVNHKVYDLLIRAQGIAKPNVRDIILPHDLPITKGMQEDIQRYKKLDEEIELEPILEHLASRPQLEMAVSPETEAELPTVAGGISVALARTFKIIDPDVKKPATEQWERAERIFDLLL